MKSKYSIHVHDLHIRDVCILPVPQEGKYYLYDSRPMPGQKGRAINVRESEDLVWWSEASHAFVPGGDFWGPLDLWAPECHYWRGKYYAVSSFRAAGGYRGCQFLVSDSPNGPFIPMVNKPATPENWHCLDGTLYEDKAGTPWMVFCHEWIQVQDGQICAIQMKEDLSDSVGEPIILFRASEAPWRFKKNCYSLWNYTAPQPKLGWARITDGPYMLRQDEKTLLMVWTSYSETAYSTGYARSLSGEIEGPWIQEDEPLFTQDGGHPMLFTRFDGKLMMTMHSPNVPGKERMLIFEMECTDGRLNIVNEITGNWMPTFYDPDGVNGTTYSDSA